MTHSVLAAAAVYFSGLVFDVVTTMACLKRGMTEGHLLLRLAGKRAPLWMAGLGGGAGAFALVAAHVAPDPNARIAFWFLLGFGLLRIVAAISNFRKLQKGAGR